MTAEERKSEVADERARRARERRMRNLAVLVERRANREENRRNQFESRQLKAGKLAHMTREAAPAKVTPAGTEPSSPDEIIEDVLLETLDPVETSRGSIADHMATYLQEYLRAEEVLREARERLISMRGSESALNDEDRDVLENLRDILAARRSKYLEL